VWRDDGIYPRAPSVGALLLQGVRLLLDAGADAAVTCWEQGYTALHLAALAGATGPVSLRIVTAVVHTCPDLSLPTGLAGATGLAPTLYALRPTPETLILQRRP